MRLLHPLRTVIGGALRVLVGRADALDALVQRALYEPPSLMLVVALLVGLLAVLHPTVTSLEAI